MLGLTGGALGCFRSATLPLCSAHPKRAALRGKAQKLTVVWATWLCISLFLTGIKA